MAINKEQTQRIFMFGAIAGFITPFLLKFLIIPVLNMLGTFIPELSLKLANPSSVISINVRDSLTGLHGGLSGWLVDSLGLTVTVPFQTYIMAAIGGGLMFVVGAYAADALGFLKGNKIEKTRAVIFTGHVIVAAILGWAAISVPVIDIAFINIVIAFLVNAALLAYVYVAIDEKAKLGLIPF